MEATLEWDAKWQAWTGRPVEGTIRETIRKLGTEVLCSYLLTIKLTLETREVRPLVENCNFPDCGGSGQVPMHDGLTQKACRWVSGAELVATQRLRVLPVLFWC